MKNNLLSGAVNLSIKNSIGFFGLSLIKDFIMSSKMSWTFSVSRYDSRDYWNLSFCFGKDSDESIYKNEIFKNPATYLFLGCIPYLFF